MQATVSPDRDTMGQAAATAGAAHLAEVLQKQGEANIIVATGNSQFEMFAHLVQVEGIDWTKVTIFHLDEYLGLSESHPASFRRYLQERFVAQLPCRPLAFHAVDGMAADPASECERLGNLISGITIDVAFVGIGENGHLAFNDPPADFTTTAPYIVVDLDEACRRQQLGEGWFESLDDVPRQAISMSVREILRANRIICTVPDTRKATAVAHAVEGPVTPQVPASILQEHSDCSLFLDEAAASQLTRGEVKE